ncbi:Ribose-phosphate pyrophosphokinase 1 [Pseudocercospora fuligena]|uniref:Ribose-phosphate pyrophosphokinase 1 n=1 Tax=Pseudocercospora fuligena TaxID=685502 RepID=A0A8H6RDI9_9PEZI|nr:Ribose-phosphate pyrophosphokinase 1 [Pseudocercospora fuligena]
MRQTCIFSGSSCPSLVNAICQRLGQKPAEVDLKKFANGETSVEIKTSVRDQDVFIVQSGSSQINDNVMEMLIMISACKGGSARSITAVMPYFPYSRQSKKKAHRGAITARMLANLMKVAGVNHVITIDLHATQMQGFFKCPVDNLFAEPLLSKWIRQNIPDWFDSVVVSKNPGGTKRVTSLADRLGLHFGIVTTDRRRPKHPPSMMNSAIFERLGEDGTNDREALEEEADENRQNSPNRSKTSPDRTQIDPKERDWASPKSKSPPGGGRRYPYRPAAPRATTASAYSSAAQARLANGSGPTSHPLANAHRPDSIDEGNEDKDEKKTEDSVEGTGLQRVRTVPTVEPSHDDDGYEESEGDDDTDERARDVITGRLIHGHIVDDDVPSPSMSHYSANRNRQSSEDEDAPEHMMQSFVSTTSSRWGAGNGQAGGLGGTGDATHSDEEEEEALQNPEIETHVTLVGNVRDRSVIIVDDMIDKTGSWIAAAETVVKRGQATKVYCMATHGLFGGDSLQQLEECDEVEAVIVTNAFPIPEETRRKSRKLIVLDVSGLLAEAIRRNHHGESISQLYHIMD